MAQAQEDGERNTETRLTKYREQGTQRAERETEGDITQTRPRQPGGKREVT